MTKVTEGASGSDRYGGGPPTDGGRRSQPRSAGQFQTKSSNVSTDGGQNSAQGGRSSQMTRKPKQRRRDGRSAPLFGTLGFYVKLTLGILGWLVGSILLFIFIARPLNTYVLQPWIGITDSGFMISYFVVVFILIYFWRQARFKHGF